MHSHQIVIAFDHPTKEQHPYITTLNIHLTLKQHFNDCNQTPGFDSNSVLAHYYDNKNGMNITGCLLKVRGEKTELQWLAADQTANTGFLFITGPHLVSVYCLS